MKYLNSIGLYWRTVKYLRFSQIYFRLKKIFFKQNIRLSDPLSKNPLNPRIDWLEKDQSIHQDGEFVFLNKRVKLELKNTWEAPEESLLWNYNLHYFDGLLSKRTSNDLKLQLINNWIEVNHPMEGIGWEPYPSSLRIVNWVKYLWQNEIHNNKISESLCYQSRLLYKNIEYHLLGNHLLENAKALIFAGCYFSGPESDKWLKKGISILEAEMSEQILDDGGHFELSTMYQCIMIELFLDILLLSDDSNFQSHFISVKNELERSLKKMASWLSGMVHPDLEISYFNDASIGISQSPEELFSKLNQNGISWVNNTELDFIYHKESGYLRVKKGDATVFFDIAEIGASYLAGHGHADALSIEVSLGNERVFCNLGTSQYGTDERRDFERSTAAHSTLELAKTSSSEVWGGFRVGRRATCNNLNIENDNNNIVISAEHNGYFHLKDSPVHKRSLLFSENYLDIKDQLSTSGLGAIVRFHINPECSVSKEPDLNSGVILTKAGNSIRWSAKAEKVFIEENHYAVSFGVLVPTKSICLFIKDQNSTSMRLNLL